MTEQNLMLETAQYKPLVPARCASTMALVALSVSVLAHGLGIFALLQFEPARAIDSGAWEIPVDIIVEANDSEPVTEQSPPAVQTERAEVEPALKSTLTTAESEPAPTLPEIAAAEPPAAAQAPISDPELPPSPSADFVQSAAASGEPVAAPPEPIAAAPTIVPARAETPSQQELQRHIHEEAGARQEEEAAAKKRAVAKQHEAMRAAARATMMHDREAALERPSRAPALAQLASTPGSDLALYRSVVLRHLAAFQHYPETARARGAHGEAVVAFTLDNAGRVVSAGISHSSGQADIDAETLAMVRRAEPFPAPPPAAQRSFSAAIEFHLE